ncbi:MAG: beta-N-acetylhexosaminidase [Candidatus Sumerlaeaceae bacterium]|nr:beta-N-acetylhexosaminidase [Candidatus Sumerlaeaceae bacterium]
MPRLRTFRPALLASSLMMAASVIIAGAGPDRRLEIRADVGQISVRYSYSGLALDVFGAPFSRASWLLVTKPGKWGELVYHPPGNDTLVAAATVTDADGRKRMTVRHALPEVLNNPFKGMETIEIGPDNNLTVRFEYSLETTDTANIEWAPVNLNADLFSGCAFSAVTDKGTTSGVLPDESFDTDWRKARLLAGVKSLELQSRLGPVRIRIEPSDADVVFEYRRDKWAVSGPRTFWVGVHNARTEPRQRRAYTVTLQFASKPVGGSAAGKSLSAVCGVTPTDAAAVPGFRRDYIVPTPRSLEFTDTACRLSDGTIVNLGEKPDELTRKAAAFFAEEVKRVYGITLAIEEGISLSCHPAIYLGDIGRTTSSAEMCASAGLTLDAHAEAYCVLVDGDRAAVSARTPRGVFHGAATLAQLIEVTTQGVFLRGAKISDYPALGFRGVHCLSGRNAGDQIAKAIRDLMARFKMNALVWQCEYVKWDVDPRIYSPQYGMEKADARKVVEACRRYGLDLIPLLQSLGHAEYAFVGANNLDIAEDPEKPYAFAVTVPRAFEFLFQLYEEIVDFTQPRIFHAGLDEFTMRGRYPFRGLPRTETELFMLTINRCREWLAKRNIQMMIWGDQFLHGRDANDAALAPTAEDAKVRRDALPKDIIITDWHYAPDPPEKFTSIKLLQDCGLRVIGAGWFNPDNIRNLAKACVDAQAMGYLQTTWAGFNFKIDDNDVSWLQYWAYILAAQYSWTGVNTPPAELPFRARDLFLDLWFERRPVLKQQPGFTVDIRPLLNRRLADTTAGTGWAGRGPNADLSAFKPGEHLFHGHRFVTAPNAHGETAVVLAGLGNPTGEFPDAVTAEIAPRRVSQLRFLITATARTNDGTVIGDIAVGYDDGSTQTMPLVYGQNVFAFDDFRMSRTTWLAWQGETALGAPVGLWDAAWINPEPSKPIRSITLKSAKQYSAPILLAITGFEELN